jgi:hypothetical protein
MADESPRRSSGSRNLVVGIVVLVLVLLAGVGVVSISGFFKQTGTTTDVVITYFGKQSGYSGGSTNNQYFIYPFNVTIVNQGSNSVSGLSVVVEVLGNGNILGSQTQQIGTLNGGNQESFTTQVTFSGDPSTLGAQTQTYTALLEQNGNVINQMNLG